MPRRWLIVALSALVLACADSEDPGPPASEAGAKLLAMPPIVGRPTGASASLNVVAGAQAVELELELEPPAGAPVEARLEAGAARDLELGGLEGGTVYRYRLTARAGGLAQVFPGRFVTRRPRRAAFTFALLADPHLPVPAPEWLDAGTAELFLPEIVEYLAARRDAGRILRQALEQIRAHEVDFLVCLGDMLHFYRGFNDPFPTAEVADYGYRDLRRHLGQTTAEAAFFAVVGNWEGENGWHPERLRRHAREARIKYLPNPGPATYPQGGGAHEDFYAWVWGDALLVVLNVMTATATVHALSPDDDGSATDWTLGAAQLAWLESTLAASRERSKLILIHHPVGGRGGDEANSAYGRGGGRAARVGEQATVHRLMVEHGVQVFFYGHDHVFTDMVVDGVHYTLPGSAGAPWKFPAEETGYEDFDERSGFALVHVGPAGLEVEFLDLSGEVFRSYSVPGG